MTSDKASRFCSWVTWFSWLPRSRLFCCLTASTRKLDGKPPASPTWQDGRSYELCVAQSASARPFGIKLTPPAPLHARDLQHLGPWAVWACVTHRIHMAPQTRTRSDSVELVQVLFCAIVGFLCMYARPDVKKSRRGIVAHDFPQSLRPTSSLFLPVLILRAAGLKEPLPGAQVSS